jgi:hypothetical protein
MVQRVTPWLVAMLVTATHLGCNQQSNGVPGGSLASAAASASWPP